MRMNNACPQLSTAHIYQVELLTFGVLTAVLTDIIQCRCMLLSIILHLYSFRGKFL